MTYKEACLNGRAALMAAGIEDASTDAYLLLFYVSGLDRTHYYLNESEQMPKDQVLSYQDLIRRRASHEPCAYLMKEQEFCGVSLLVAPSVLIPRQDTELLARCAIAHLKEGMRILDLCTGSGALAIVIKLAGANVSVTGCDLSDEALSVAKENGIRSHAVIEWIHSDLFGSIGGTFDMIVSNPPYIRTSVIGTLEPEVAFHEPLAALDGGEDGLVFYRRIIKDAGRFLNPGAWLFFEIGYDQAEDVCRMLAENGYTQIQTQKDLSGHDRVVSARRPF